MVGELLKKARKVKGYTLKELSALSGYSIGRLSNYEQDRSEPNFEVLKALASILGVDPGYFMQDAAGIVAQAQTPVNQDHLNLDKNSEDAVNKLIEIVASQQELIKKLVDLIR